jgi:hypothetical protein
MKLIDTTFDFRTESGTRDSDSASLTLRSYHQILWSKELPSGGKLQIREDSKKYLIASSPIEGLRLTSDSITNSMAGHKALSQIVSKVKKGLVEDVKSFGSTIGSRLVFPGDQIDGGKTLNVLRGFNPKIRDRFDLTLECIRRHYIGEQSPLTSALGRYSDFFKLFNDFEGYVEFFLLQDMVHGKKVVFFTDIDWPSSGGPYPLTVAEYDLYAKRTIEFVECRNSRINVWSRENS